MGRVGEPVEVGGGHTIFHPYRVQVLPRTIAQELGKRRVLKDALLAVMPERPGLYTPAVVGS